MFLVSKNLRKSRTSKTSSADGEISCYLTKHEKRGTTKLYIMSSYCIFKNRLSACLQAFVFIIVFFSITIQFIEFLTGKWDLKDMNIDGNAIMDQRISALEEKNILFLQHIQGEMLQKDNLISELNEKINDIEKKVKQLIDFTLLLNNTLSNAKKQDFFLKLAAPKVRRLNEDLYSVNASSRSPQVHDLHEKTETLFFQDTRQLSTNDTAEPKQLSNSTNLICNEGPI